MTAFQVIRLDEARRHAQALMTVFVGPGEEGRDRLGQWMEK